MGLPRRITVPAAADALIAPALAAADLSPGQHRHQMLLISVDGLHQAGLNWRVAHRPSSTPARPVHRGWTLRIPVARGVESFPQHAHTSPGTGVNHAQNTVEPVELTQIAPMTRRLLRPHPAELQAVERKHSPALLGPDSECHLAPARARKDVDE
ncbi:MAG: hypothetical protein JO287_07090 [Pseudonocardiales bacterium]|nr:hypothetical protein [Pseudonocardiales bacterium]